MDSMRGDVSIRISQQQDGVIDFELWDGDRRVRSRQFVNLTIEAARTMARRQMTEARTMARQHITESRARLKEIRKRTKEYRQRPAEREAVREAVREFRRLQPARIERFPRLWRLFAFVLPRGIRTQSFEPALEDMLAQHLKARRYRTVWARRWLVLAFTIRTVIAVLDCVRLMLVQHILQLLPRRVRDWWTT